MSHPLTLLCIHSSCLSSQFRSPNKSFCFDLCYGPIASVHFPNDTHASCVCFVPSFADMLCHSVIVDVSVLWFGARVPCWCPLHIFLYLSLWLRLDDDTTCHCSQFSVVCIERSATSTNITLPRGKYATVRSRRYGSAVPDWNLVPVHTTPHRHHLIVDSSYIRRTR
ncbi:hypothetical protein ARMGADRAFT_741283 [Armillaria gallica]|uniref:Uncharacterized protein n=1 Tax=Armillaria gallica TaxID=47427 RepID=A0A2H3CST2_ARMGA|nr:hypothetical protein ARMGADRAFT_741283 [Armillaria gallica]